METRNQQLKLIALSILLIFCSHIGLGQKQTNARAQWFTEARFGMFIHWGIYSGAEGIWKGEKLRNDNNYAEWIYYRNSIEKEEYLSLLDRFDWEEIDPEEWVLLAKKSGMKYITITAKHHDGFALWDSKVSDYDLGNYTNPSRDIIKELADACKKHDIKLGLYYSHWVDWEHEYGWDHTREITGISPEDYNKYWQEKVIPQVRELLTNYGMIDLFWFDMWIHHSETVVTKEQLLQLKGLIRKLQPECLVNSRLGLSIQEDPDVDFKTLGDNQLGSKKEDFPWQSPATVAHSWGFHALDTEFKSTTTLLKSLIGNVSLNGNFMLNIGPRANGDVQHEVAQRMLEMGKWLDVNGEAIYGAEAFDLKNYMHDWGKITFRQTSQSSKLYLHVFNWPLNKKLYLTGIKGKPEKIYLLADKQQKALSFSHTDVYTEIDLPSLQPDPYVSVVTVEYSQKPEAIEELVAKTNDSGYALTLANQTNSGAFIKVQSGSRRGTVPEHASVNQKQSLKWKLYIDQPGDKSIDISYSFQGDDSNSKIIIKAAGDSVQHIVQPTGKTVGEPNADWIIDNFKSFSAGTINFPKRGIYEVNAEIVPLENQKIHFQWVWIK